MLCTLSKEEWLSHSKNIESVVKQSLIVSLVSLLEKLNSSVSIYHILDVSHKIVAKCEQALAGNTLTILTKGMVKTLLDNIIEFVRVLLNLNTRIQVVNALNERNEYNKIDPLYLPGQINIPLNCEQSVLNDRSLYVKELVKLRFSQLAVGRLRFLNIAKDSYHKEYFAREQSPIKYFSVDDRENFRVILSGGKFLKIVFTNEGGGNRLRLAHYDTSNEYSHEGEIGKGRAIFVMTPRGDFYSGSKIKNLIQHSSFVCGSATLFAGFWKLKKGRLESIANYSGHYITTLKQILFLLDFLEQSGVDISETEVKRIYEVMDITVEPTFTSTSVIEFRRIMQLNRDKITGAGQLLPPLGNVYEAVSSKKAVKDVREEVGENSQEESEIININLTCRI